MIKLTRIQNDIVYINENNIQWIECTSDTIITFINGYRFIVKETLEQVLDLIKNSCSSEQLKLEKSENQENIASNHEMNDIQIFS